MFVQVKDLNMFSNPCFVIRTVSWLTYDDIGIKHGNKIQELSISIFLCNQLTIVIFLYTMEALDIGSM